MSAKPKVDTPRDGKAWCDVVNDPIPQHVKDHRMTTVLALGSCDADGSNFKPYDKPIVRQVPAPVGPTGTYLWLDREGECSSESK